MTIVAITDPCHVTAPVIQNEVIMLAGQQKAADSSQSSDILSVESNSRQWGQPEMVLGTSYKLTGA